MDNITVSIKKTWTTLQFQSRKHGQHYSFNQENMDNITVSIKKTWTTLQFSIKKIWITLKFNMALTGRCRRQFWHLADFALHESGMVEECASWTVPILFRLFRLGWSRRWRTRWRHWENFKIKFLKFNCEIYKITTALHRNLFVSSRFLVVATNTKNRVFVQTSDKKFHDFSMTFLRERLEQSMEHKKLKKSAITGIN